jgi:membrane protease YdiL (CAAX protease family)
MASGVGLLAALVATWVGERALRHRPPDFGLTDARRWRQLAIGGGLGALLLTLSVGTAWLLGHEHLAFGGVSAAVGVPTARLVLSVAIGAAAEEMVFRGFLLRRLQRRLGAAWAVFILGSLFGVFHAMTPNASWVSVGTIALAGWLFGALAIRSGSLWMPICLHASWNWFEGYVWGEPVSGKAAGVGWLVREGFDASVWTGGKYGPEASIQTAVLLALVLGWLIVRWPRPSTAPELSA